MRAAHGQRCTTNHLLVPQQLYRNTDTFGLLNLQTAQHHAHLPARSPKSPSPGTFTASPRGQMVPEPTAQRWLTRGFPLSAQETGKATMLL